MTTDSYDSISNYDESNSAWNDSHLDNKRTCPTCRGTGLNRWEDDDCGRCNGEGEI